MAQRVLVDQLNIHTTYDLRADKEVAVKSYDIPRIARNHVPIDATQISKYIEEGEDFRESPVSFRMMQGLYRDFVQSYGLTFGTVIKGILATDSSPHNASLFHCTAGKDRTGWTRTCSIVARYQRGGEAQGLPAHEHVLQGTARCL
ncbi:hypothetical protein ABB37_02370 [Leptomonas pyrrhocoris]|uniref:Tyrosine specific protein phosphatases domain-containing protein n=1 Tax=Leptomonas pyrrhocoris TaxID=157538 RepID=A0A0N0DYT1_LEPPY|nr:hypothetical protein ABB37_02370 [Leptomonas pyrrhocoris]XP_015662822.1 hypothetical protein ABB37_02370 [Leptomonas pyrrhocoris]KPA84382.1 hypothetical protein ABB37_02370 [Leptomonas pyrrhocoris]KPA84383.1 hypothetical protein ABB37_02370 [Leptomonas pyrrhocoris]|eukprot:XP_015662821.1 hypothetical protein ABB37_02370 [Leptomonas pyrrhocoris]